MSSKRYIDIDRTLQNLEDEISQENHQAVKKFINHQAAEGVGIQQQERQIYSLRRVVRQFSHEDFKLEGASEDELKDVMASMNRSDYAPSTKHKIRGALKKFYKVMNGGHEHPEKVQFFSTNPKHNSTVSRDDLLTEDERKALFRSFTSTRDRAFIMTMYEAAARPGELLECSIADFTSDEKGDFIFLQGKKQTPDRTNQLVRAGRPIREWLAQHPLGGELGDIDDETAPLWVKTEQQNCNNCGETNWGHSNSSCNNYEPDLSDRYTYQAFRRRFHKACEKADIPENKRRPYNLRHTRLTEVATFMGYEQLNKFAGWKPGSDRAKVYVHLNNDDVNQAIRDRYGLDPSTDEEQEIRCSFCGAQNQSEHSECRNCGRPLSLEDEKDRMEKQEVLEKLAELDEDGVLDKLEKLDQVD
jgi:integrase